MSKDLLQRTRLLIFLFSLAGIPGLTAAQSVPLRGEVRDSAGAAVAGARVSLTAGSFSASQITDSSGAFSFDSVPAGEGRISVEARGFALYQQSLKATPASTLQIALSPMTVMERIVVTATRTETRLSDVSASAISLDNQDLDATPALLVDDKLRQIPGFTLFRRTGSRTANPTSQGVSLSGLGASGASRALVLQDGIPLNDPFGGWVYWGRVPQAELDTVEVVRSGISSLYGNNALGGVVQFLSHTPEAPGISLETSYGSQQTPDLSVWAGKRVGRWDGAVSTDLFHTDGYILVPSSQRGSVDTVANAEHAVVDLTLGRQVGENGRIFGRGSFFTEGRHNGTPLQINDTRIGQASLGADAPLGAFGSVALRMYGDIQDYNQSFSSIAADRNSESLTNLQHVPAQQLGASASWSKPLTKIQTLVAGFEAAQVMGWSDESIFSSGTHLRDTVAGGRQRTLGLYGEDILRLTPKWIATIGGRFDHWRNFDAESVRMPVTPPGPTTIAPFDERSENAFSPRVSILHPVTSNISLNVSGYRSFRAPTLNELYRAFRVGNVQTLANSDLRAERLTGAEAGANAFAFNRRLNLRGTFFWDDIVNPIANVTLNANANPILRQRQNLGRTRSHGVELDASVRVSSTIELSGGYQFVDASVASFPAPGTSLVGLDLPQVPRNQFTVQARYWNPRRFMLSVQGRYVGSQFEDDQNLMVLDRYFTVDLLAGRSLGHGIEAFGAFENLFNERYVVGLTPVPTLGAPFSARIGLRLKLPSRY